MEKKEENGTEKSLKDTVSDSDFVEDKLTANSLDEHRKELLGKYEREFVLAAAGALKNKLMQIAVEAGRCGAQVAMDGEDLIETHRKEIEKKESELSELKREKRELENELKRLKGKNKKLETAIEQKETEIRRMQNEIDRLKRLIKKKEKEIAANQTAPNEKERNLLLEIEKLRKTYDEKRGELQEKNDSGSIKKDELKKLRQKITELELHLEDAKAMKK